MQTNIFGISLQLVKGSQIQNRIPVSIITSNGKIFQDIFIYDPVSKLVQWDNENVRILLNHIRGVSSTGFNRILIMISRGITTSVNSLKNYVVYFFTREEGASFIHLFLGLILGFILLYAYIFTAPFFAINYFFARNENSKNNEMIKIIAQNAIEVAKLNAF